MTTATLSRPLAAERVVLRDVSWELYEMLLHELDGQHVYLTYDNGSLELMSPAPEHEWAKKMIGGLIEVLALERNIPMARRGSTTFRREDLRKGLEPDECYYIQRAADIRGKKRYDLTKDPAPDLVVEVDITHHAIDRERIYAALGVPELWRFDGVRLEALALQPDGSYKAQSHSVAFPWLQVAQLQGFLERLAAEEETSVLRAFRDWVREQAE